MRWREMTRLGPIVRGRALWSSVGLLALSLSLGACFDPTIARCAVQCGAEELCPSGTTCLSDGMCHASGQETLCSTIAPDASQEADSTVSIDAMPADASTTDAGGECGNGLVQSQLGETCDDGNSEGQDGCSNVCRTEPGFFCLGAPSDCAAAPSPGQLVIREIMKDPCGDQGSDCTVNDIDGEWFEIQNITSKKLQLLNMIIRDNDVESVSISTPLTIGPGQILVLGNNGNMADNGGVALDYQYLNTFILANGTDEIILVNPLTTAEIDRVFYNGGFPDFPGASLSLDPDFTTTVLNDIPANWCDGNDTFGNGDFGTPGQANPQCP